MGEKGSNEIEQRERVLIVNYDKAVVLLREFLNNTNEASDDELREAIKILPRKKKLKEI